MNFLCFRVRGPLASWGETAVGEVRSSGSAPTRSGVLGILGASLGIRRGNADALASLDQALGVASLTMVPGSLMVDYHTAQVADGAALRTARRIGTRASAFASTRADELSIPLHALDTQLSTRQYRVDAEWRVAVWVHESNSTKWSLEQLAAALSAPQFVPYLGRKSCALDVPMQPQIIDAVNPVVAMAGAKFIELQRADSNDVGETLVARWEGEWVDLMPTQTVRRRDKVASRARWQFAERNEHIGSWPRKDVPHVSKSS